MSQKDNIASFYDIRGRDAIGRRELSTISPSFANPYNYAYEMALEHLQSGAKILDFACGTGHHSIRLSQMGFKVTGVDLSEQSIQAAKSLSEAVGEDCEFHLGDHTIPAIADEKFDAIFISGALYYLEPDFFATWFYDHLENGGVLISVETLGSNWLLSKFRAVKSLIVNTRDEQTLTSLWSNEQFENFGNHFTRHKIRYFDLFGLGGRVFKRWPKLEAAFVRAVFPLDNFILNKVINKLAFKVVLVAEKLEQ